MTPCPFCGSEEVVPIVYGLPDAELEDRARRGEVRLGGCIVTLDQPDHSCRDCGGEWQAAA